MKLSMVSIERDGSIRVQTDGNITASDMDLTGPNPFEKLLGVNWAANRVIVDFSKTEYIDSSAIGWLISTNRTFKEKGGMLVVHSIQPQVRQILDVLKIGKVVPLVEDETAARALIAAR
jgi:anti-anti-sigma factor